MSGREFDLCLVADAVDVLLVVFDSAVCAIFWMSAPDKEGRLLSDGEQAGVKEYNELCVFAGLDAPLLLLFLVLASECID
jgi:hypothetical protein